MLAESGVRKWQRRILDTLVRHHPALGLDRRAELFVKLFEKHLPPGSHILDIGGGWGFYGEPLSVRGHYVTVLDVVKPSFQKSPLVLYDGGRIPFPDKSFDISLFITVLHHIQDIEQVVKEARRVTKRYVVVVEDLYHHRLGRWWTILRDQIYNFEFCGHPKNFKTGQEWIRFFEGHGCGLKAFDQVYTWLSGMRILNGVFVFRADGAET